MHIGRVAKKIGLTPDTIRLYERNALLPRPPRSAGGFRQYADKDVETLEFIRQVQGLGFTLKQVRELLELRGLAKQPCAPVRRRLEQKLKDVRSKLADLQKLEQQLGAALHACGNKQRGRTARCPLLSKPDPQKPVNGK
jgi:DNA-binding transcriptional MerR regulator